MLPGIYPKSMHFRVHTYDCSPGSLSSLLSLILWVIDLTEIMKVLLYFAAVAQSGRALFWTLWL